MKGRDVRALRVAQLRALAQSLGRNPTHREISAHFGMAWQSIAVRFCGRQRRRMPDGSQRHRDVTNGFHRWARLAGVGINPKGWPKGRPNPWTRKKRTQLTRARREARLVPLAAAHRCPCGGVLVPGREQEHRCAYRMAG